MSSRYRRRVWRRSPRWDSKSCILSRSSPVICLNERRACLISILIRIYDSRISVVDRLVYFVEIPTGHSPTLKYLWTMYKTLLSTCR